MTAATVSPSPSRRWIKNPRDFLVFLMIFVLISLVISAIAFLLWVSNPAQPGGIALAALETSETVEVTQANGVITFDPLTPDQQPIGLIFYPGALVDPRAYAPILRPLAESGYFVITQYMPLNLAVFNINAADALRAAHPEIETWAIFGHSMGGAMASRYTLEHSDIVGLALLATIPFGDLSGVSIPVYSIYGDTDGLITLSAIEENRAALPASTEYVLIEGANHAQFGDYGTQRNDLPAVISLTTQHTAIVEALFAFLEAVTQSQVE